MAKPSAKRSTKQANTALPNWNLKDFYTSPKDPRINTDMQTADKRCTRFAKQYKGKVTKLTPPQLAKAISDYEAIEEVLGKVASYAQLLYAADMSKPEHAQFYQTVEEQVTALSSEVLFFTLELNQVSEAKITSWKKNKKVARYAPWLRDVRSYKPYQLSDDLEKLLHEKRVTGHSAWSRLFDETIARLRFPVASKKLTSAEAFNLLSSADAKKRKTAAKSIGKTLGENAEVFALITNTLAKDKDIEDRWRGFDKPISSRNIANQVEDEVVDALIKSVKKRYPDLSHRYYKLKAKWYGKKTMRYWDRNAPLPDVKEKKYNWPEATELVLSSYMAFSPTLAKIGRDFFEKNWIDVPVRTGKSPGAFAHPTVPSVHPYLLLNFQGKTRDVMTLAHELGHGVHQVLSAEQGALMCDTPLTLAETASVFGEQLTFRGILQREKNEKRRKAMIASKVEDMLNTVVRQIAFCEFERIVHDERKEGELSVDRICEIWMQVQSESLGPAITYEEEYKYYWTYIPHFIHSAFYVYAYAFGDCLVNSLYAVYQKEQAKGNAQAFEQKYIEMLKAGGTLRHKELLAPFGLDASKPKFWNEGLDIISDFIDELE